MNPSETAEQSGPDTDIANRVSDLLVGYLLRAGRGTWPGTDGLTVAEAVGAFYPAEARAGHVPGSAELVGRHPELAAGIGAFFGRTGHARRFTGGDNKGPGFVE